MRAWREEANGSSRRISARVAAPEHDVAVEVVDHARLVARARARRPGAARDARRRAGRRLEAEYRPVASAAASTAIALRVGAAAPRAAAGRAARCAPPTAGTGRARRGSRTSARPIRAASVVIRPRRRSRSSRARRGRRAAAASRRAPSRPLSAHAVGRAEVRDRSSRPRAGRISAWRREIAGVVEHDVAVAAAPDRRRRPAARAGAAHRRPAARARARAPAPPATGPPTRAEVL